MNLEGIGARQNKPGLLELLRAQRRFYGKAKTIQAWFVVASLLLPAISLFMADQSQKVKPGVALISVVVLLLEVAYFSKRQKDFAKKGAKVQEDIDTNVLDLPWNRLVAGRAVDPEDIRGLTCKPMSDDERKGLVDWYAPCVDELPVHVGRLICQRTNITYDRRVRSRYANALLVAAVLLFTGLLAAAFLQERMTLEAFVLALLVPATPFFTWSLREYRKHADSLDALETIKSEVDKVWDKALDGADEKTLTQEARGIQDAIYRYRASNPLVFDWLYKLLRSNNEDVANHSAQQLVSIARKRLGLEDAK